MLYLSGAVSPRFEALGVGWMLQPNMGNRIPLVGQIGADNACFSQQFSRKRWARFLARLPRDRVLFAVVPDVVGNHNATLYRWHRYNWLPKSYGLRAAFALQDGAEPNNVPWDEVGAIFIGGTNAWKYDTRREYTMAVVRLIDAAKQRGLHVHAGRVNSARRFEMVAGHDVDSCDGTYLRWPTPSNMARVASWSKQDTQRRIIEYR